jgi:hypothetical protein
MKITVKFKPQSADDLGLGLASMGHVEPLSP